MLETVGSHPSSWNACLRATMASSNALSTGILWVRWCNLQNGGKMVFLGIVGWSRSVAMWMCKCAAWQCSWHLCSRCNWDRQRKWILAMVGKCGRMDISEVWWESGCNSPRHGSWQIRRCWASTIADVLDSSHGPIHQSHVDPQISRKHYTSSHS